MLKVKVKAKKVWKPYEIAMMNSALQWAAEELEIFYSPVPITVKLKGYSGGDFGYCVDLDDRICITVCKHENYLKTLFHELEHARQYLDDELELEHETAVWKGKFYKRKAKGYYREPWEIKARKIERKLFKRFTKSLLTLND